MATMGLTSDEQQAVERFQNDVVRPSMEQLVILDFWAEWCGPCKALTPVLESVAAQYADKGVLLAKVNVDEERFIASQFQVQSIPTVYAIFQGKPVADLTQARSESQLKQVLDQLLAQLPVKAGGDAQQQQQDISPLLAMGEEVLNGGDHERAMGIFAQIIDMAPDEPAAHGGLIRALVAADRIDDAEAALGMVPENSAADPAIERAKAAIELARNKPSDDETAALAKAVADNPDDHQARFDLAGAQIASGQHQEASDNLLHIIQADREWNDGAAREKLLALFEMVGLEDEWVAKQRRRLSLILFG